MNMKQVADTKSVNKSLTLWCHLENSMDKYSCTTYCFEIYFDLDCDCWVMYEKVFFFPLCVYVVINCHIHILISVQLQHHARHRLPTFQLIFVHVIESLVFVPVSMQLQLLSFLFFPIFSPLMDLLTCLLILYPDNDWNPIFSLRVLWWSAFGFYGLNSCLDLWTLHANQVVPFSFSLLLST